MNECEGCRWHVKKLRKFMHWVSWCLKYDCAARYKCIDWKGKK